MWATNKMQQIPFIDLFKIGSTCFRRQTFGIMHRYCCQPVTGLRWSSISTLSPVGSNIGALYQKLYIQSKSAPEDGRVCRRKHVEPILKRSINGICCILLVAYVVVLMMHGLTNVILFLNLPYSGRCNKIQWTFLSLCRLSAVSRRLRCWQQQVNMKPAFKIKIMYFEVMCRLL